jgi:hypothetical protein
MIHEISEDVKEFLLSYIKIHQLISLAQNELNNVNAALEAEISKQSWFSLMFRTARSGKVVQVWKEPWHPSVTPGCPWIHFEYIFSWPDRWVQGSLDIESGRIVSQDTILKFSSRLCALLSAKQPALIGAPGWILKPQLEGNRMLLLNREDVVETNFSAEWMFTTGRRLINELSEAIPYIDQVIEEMFGRK